VSARRDAEPVADAQVTLPYERNYDSAERRHSLRKGGERGASIYIPGAELQKTGYDPYGDPPYYRVWGASRGRIVVQLYKSRGPASRARAAE
jgi:hypothetical protein